MLEDTLDMPVTCNGFIVPTGQVCIVIYEELAHLQIAAFSSAISPCSNPAA